MTTTTSYVLNLREGIDPRHAGRKAATLARLQRDGFPVPDGVVLVCEALDDALAEAGLPVDAPTDAVAAIKIPAAITSGLRAAVRRWHGVPLAVRSSGVEEDLASTSYAGLYTTVLNVTGESGLLDAVRQCWASAFSDLVRSYRTKSGGESPQLAVLVQPMVEATAAGVAFTADPVTGERDVVLVEAVRGLGERLVSGAASPDEWVMQGDSAYRRTTTGEDAIDAGVATAVATLARQVEQYFGGPQDLEWALADGDVVLLQARPVTTLLKPQVKPVPVAAEPPPGYWTREASHAPAPWTPFARVVLSSRTPTYRNMCAQIGLMFDTIDFRDIGGWEYIRVVPLGANDRPGRVGACVAAMRADVCGRTVGRWYEEWQGEFARRFATLRDIDLAELTDSGLGAHLTTVLELIAYGFGVHFMLQGAIAITLAELAFTCRELLGLDNAHTFGLLAGLSGKSTEPSRAFGPLAKLARGRPALQRSLIERAPAEVVLAQDEYFAAAFTEFMQTHGCRALRLEVADQNLEERPDLVIGLIADQLAKDVDPDRTDATFVARRKQAAADIRSRLTSAGDQARFDRALARAEKAYPVREDNEYFTISVPLALIRRAALEIGHRLADRGQLDIRDDVFQVEPREAQEALRDGADRRELVTRAKGEHAWVLAHPGPASYGKDPGPPPAFGSLPAEVRLANEGFLWSVEQIFGPDATRRVGADNMVSGIPASPGSYTGPVRVIRSEAEFDRLRAGDVLVCPVTSPVWSVLFPSIGALVTDAGGILSHPAIIAREYGLPAVVATGNGTLALHDGQLVTVDGTSGLVHVAPMNHGSTGTAGQLWTGSPWHGDAAAHRVSSRGEDS
jgi:phosphohistidine swiveling domain-containing protein